MLTDAHGSQEERSKNSKVSALIERLRGHVRKPVSVDGKFESFADFMRANKLLDGGIINDFVTQDYFAPPHQRSQRLPIVNLYKWYRSTSTTGATPATTADKVFKDFYLEQDACRTAACESLRARLRHYIVAFYRAEVPENCSRRASAGRSVLRNLAQELVASKQTSRAIGNDVREMLSWWYQQQRNHAMLNRDAHNLRAEHDSDFWNIYRSPERKLRTRETRANCSTLGKSFKPSETASKKKPRPNKVPNFFHPEKPVKTDLFDSSMRSWRKKPNTAMTTTMASNNHRPSANDIALNGSGSSIIHSNGNTRPASRAVSSRQGGARNTAMSEIGNSEYHGGARGASRGSSRGSAAASATALPDTLQGMSRSHAASRDGFQSRSESKGRRLARTSQSETSLALLQPPHQNQWNEQLSNGLDGELRGPGLDLAMLAAASGVAAERLRFQEFNQCARAERAGALRRLADQHRKQQTTLPAIAPTMHACGVVIDEVYAAQDLRKQEIESPGLGSIPSTTAAGGAGGARGLGGAGGGASTHKKHDSKKTGSLVPASGTFRILGPENEESNRLPPVVGLPGFFGGTGGKQIVGAGGVALPSAEQQEKARQPAEQYMQVCDAAGAVPKPQVMAMATTSQIRAGLDTELITDCDLAALTVMVSQMVGLQVVDLAGSATLSDKAISAFLQKLQRHGSGVTLLNLNACKGFGPGSLDVLIALLGNASISVGGGGIGSLSSLLHMDLGSIALPSSRLPDLCYVLSTLPLLQTLDLSDTGLGLHRDAVDCIATLMEAPVLEKLDLSWNSFTSEVFLAIGEGACKHKVLQSLKLANCAVPGATDSISPIAVFFESLAKDNTLTDLDVSSNRIDYRAALVVEDGLQNHANLSCLTVANNPLGSDGFRSLLRLLCRETSGLIQIWCTECESPSDVALDIVHYSCANPSGGYELRLWKPHHRAVLRMLYKTCGLLNLSPEECFAEMRCDPHASGAVSETGQQEGLTLLSNAYHHPPKDEHGMWLVPMRGALKFQFNIDGVFTRLLPAEQGQHLTGRAPVDIAAAGLTEYLSMVCLQPRGRKAAALLAQWHGFFEDPLNHKFMLQALAQDFLLDASHIRHLCGLYGEWSTKVLEKLLHCTIGRPLERYQCIMMLPRLEDYLRVHERCRNLFALNIESATGHYKLDLASPSDRAVAECIVLLDKWEAAVAKAQGRQDPSMHRKWTNIRTCMHRQLEVTDLRDWHMPPNECMEFDFATWRRPPPNAVPLGFTAWKQCLLKLKSSVLPMEDKLQAFQGVAHCFYVSSLQIREMLGQCQNSELRVRWLVMSCLRVTDPQNLKMVRSRLSNTSDWDELRRRVGTLALFPYIQPEEENFSLNLSMHDERTAASLAVSLSLRERVENIKEPRFVKLDGEVSRFPQGIPSYWSDVEKVPRDGIWKFNYICGVGDRQLGFRKEMAAQYGGWNHGWSSENAIIWWKSVQAAKPPVVTFVRRCMHHFADPYDLFRRIVPDGAIAGTATRQAFTKVVRALGWREFSEDQDLLKHVFRALNPDNTGQLSVGDWDAVRQLSYDLRMCVIELLRHVSEIWNGNFEEAFQDVDLDGNGRIEKCEWDWLVGKTKYFGPDLEIFLFYAVQPADAPPNSAPVLTIEAWRTMVTAWQNRAHTVSEILRGNQRTLSPGRKDRRVSSSSERRGSTSERRGSTSERRGSTQNLSQAD